MSAPLPQTVSPASAALTAVSSLNQGSFRPHPLETADFGRKLDQLGSPGEADRDPSDRAQITMTVGVVARGTEECPGQACPEGGDVFDQSPPEAGRQPKLPAAVREGLALIDDARPPRNLGGRPKTIDDVAKIKIATLMATGASLRQVAGFLGVSHSTVSAAIAADPALKQEIDAARQRAVLHPLACIVRESGRNWKAAVWLMDYLNKQTVRERPRDERNRQAAEETAAAWIQNDLAGAMREEAKRARLAEQRRQENDEWRQEIAARKARKLARVQRQAQAGNSGRGAPPVPPALPAT